MKKKILRLYFKLSRLVRPLRTPEEWRILWHREHNIH